MHQICDWVKYHEFKLFVVTFEPMKIPTLSEPKNDRPEPNCCERLASKLRPKTQIYDS